MQYILTEEEYTELTAKAKLYAHSELNLKLLTSKYKELESKYNKLLVYGVSTTNERLKQQ